MRKGILGSIAALAAGAGTAWAAAPVTAADPPPPAAVAPAFADPGVVPANGPLLPPGLAPSGPAPVIMPPVQFGPPHDPQGLGPVLGNGPPPGPMYPNPGPYAAPTWQPSAPGHGAGVPSGTPGAAPHVWTHVDYLMYFAKAQPVHFPLLTTSAPSDAGLLGRPSTLVLAGQGDLGYNTISGFRVTSGFYGDADRRIGFEASGFVTEQKSNITDVTSSPTGIPTLARPFLDTATPTVASSLLVANPNFGSGRVLIDTSTQTWGVEANGVWNLYRSAPGCSRWGCSIEFLAGYRFLQVKEDLEIDSITNLDLPPAAVTLIGPPGPFGQINIIGVATVPGVTTFAGLPVASPSSLVVQDRILVYNNFNGGQVGLRGEAHCGMFVINMSSKLAIGNMHSRVEITGQSGFNNPTTGQIGTAFGGLYATSTNIGTYNLDDFAVVPEANVNVGVYITRGLSVFLGYNFLYTNKIVRPGSQVNPLVDTSTVPASVNYGATNRPAAFRLPIETEDFFLMGVNFGLRLQY
jgi:hypothetical protein